MSKIKSFKEFLNEFEIDGEHQQGKPLWNGKDYLNENGNIDLRKMNLTELPCIFPEVWEKSFYCDDNKLTSLKGAPQEVGGDFYCSENNLTSLKGAPNVVGGTFNCNYNELTSLEGAPKIVGGSFMCFYNKLTSLEGAPQKVGGNFDCGSNQLTSLKGAPKEAGESFSCRNNPTKFTEEDIQRISKVEGTIYV